MAVAGVLVVAGAVMLAVAVAGSLELRRTVAVVVVVCVGGR